jgi:hypothetical protein
MKDASLKSSLPATRKTSSPIASLLFWVFVLIVLGAVGYWYVNFSTFAVGH